MSARGGTLERVIGKLREAEIGVSLFIDPAPRAVLIGLERAVVELRASIAAGAARASRAPAVVA